MNYRCPDPTPEQLALGATLDTDVYDRCGYGITDTPATDVLCAACLIHDEMFMLGGSAELWSQVNKNFRRDCRILALAVDDELQKILELAKAVAFADIVDTVSWEAWHPIDRNNFTTRKQGEAFMKDAKDHINACALKIGEVPPYGVEA